MTSPYSQMLDSAPTFGGIKDGLFNSKASLLTGDARRAASAPFGADLARDRPPDPLNAPDPRPPAQPPEPDPPPDPPPPPRRPPTRCKLDRRFHPHFSVPDPAKPGRSSPFAEGSSFSEGYPSQLLRQSNTRANAAEATTSPAKRPTPGAAPAAKKPKTPNLSPFPLYPPNQTFHKVHLGRCPFRSFRCRSGNRRWRLLLVGDLS